MRDHACTYITAEAFLLARQARERKQRRKHGSRRMIFMGAGILAVLLLASWSY